MSKKNKRKLKDEIPNEIKILFGRFYVFSFVYILFFFLIYPFFLVHYISYYSSIILFAFFPFFYFLNKT